MSIEAERAALRLLLYRNGYPPIPVEGKRPIQKAWETKTETNAGEIDLWNKVYPTARNTGVLTRLMPTIDIDIKMQEAAEAVERLVAEKFEERGYVLVRIGEPPKRAIPFRTESPFSKITANLTAPSGATEKIELLCDGQQVVCFGVHPGTGKPYSWHGGEPGQIAWSELPYISADEAQSLIDEAANLLVAQFGYELQVSRPKQQRKANGHDEGGSPADWAWLLNNIHNGHELHDSSVALAAKLVSSGMSEGAAVNFLRAAFEASVAPHDERWQERYDDIPRDVRSARDKYAREEEVAKPPLTPIELTDASAFEGIEPRARSWAVIDRIPMCNVTLFGGDGAAGKTTVALQLCVAVAAGQTDWLRGIVDITGPVLFFTAEEDQDEIIRRLNAIVTKRQLSFAALKGLFVHTAPGRNCTLAAPNRAGQLQPTDLYHRIRLTIEKVRPTLVVLESSADLFGGNEIDRVHVRQFITLLRALAMICGSALVLLSHPSLSGLGSGSGMSGSTAWNNSVRSRLYFTHSDNKDEPNLRELKVMKSNYGPPGEIIKCVWSDGIFAVENEFTDPLKQASLDQKAQTIFLACLDDHWRKKIWVNNKPTSRSQYAPKIFAKLDTAKSLADRDATRISLLEKAMNELLKVPDDPEKHPVLTVQQYGAPSKDLWRLVHAEPAEHKIQRADLPADIRADLFKTPC